ncbi:hypothetical protein Tco_1307863 [Tanacetum coccineum]
MGMGVVSIKNGIRVSLPPRLQTRVDAQEKKHRQVINVVGSLVSMHSKSGIKRGHSLSPRLEWESSPSIMGLKSPSLLSLKPPMGSVTRGEKNLVHMGLDQ